MQRREFLLCLTLAASLPACGRKKKTRPPLAPGSLVLAFGDSVTFGTGATPSESWPSRLAEKTGWKITNAGIPGDTAESGKQRIGPLLTEPPSLVIIEMGGNDFLRRRSASSVKEDLREIVRQAKQATSTVALVGVPELSFMSVIAHQPTDSPIYRELAREEEILLISDVFSNVLGRPELCADQIHPNAEGYRVMTEGIHAALRQSGLIAENP